MNFAVEEGELWQFLKLNRKTAVRYRENPDGSYEILEEYFKIITRKFHPYLIQIIFHLDHFIFHPHADPYFTLTILSPSAEFHLGSSFTLIRILSSPKFHPEPNFTPSKISP